LTADAAAAISAAVATFTLRDTEVFALAVGVTLLAISTVSADATTAVATALDATAFRHTGGLFTLAVGVTHLPLRTIAVHVTAALILDTVAAGHITDLSVGAVGVVLAGIGATVAVRLWTPFRNLGTGYAVTFGLADDGGIGASTHHDALIPGDAAIRVAAVGDLRDRAVFALRRRARTFEALPIGITGTVVVVAGTVLVGVVAVAAALIFTTQAIKLAVAGCEPFEALAVVA
jgi:hypothetical protein